MRNVFVLFIALLAFGPLAQADGGYCTAQDSSDHYWKSVCSHKSKTLCEWEENCRWAYSSAGTCEARDSSDGFWRSVCSHKSKTLCQWEENCVWND
jgi:hypothetical protein